MPPSAESTPPTLGPSLSSGRIVRRLFGLAWRYRAPWLGVIAIQLVLLTLGVSGLSLTGVGIDYIRHVLQGTPVPRLPFGFALPAWEPMAVLALIAGAILALAGVRSLLNYTYALRVNHLTQQEIVPWLRGRVYDKLQQLSFRFFDENSTGSIINRVTGDVQAVRMFLDQVLVQSVIMLVSLGVYIVYMANLAPGLTLACLATTPLLWTLSAVFTRRMLPLYAKNRDLADDMVRALAESVQGAPVVKAFGREAENRADFLRRNDAVLNQQRAIFWRVSLFSPTVGFLTRVNIAVLLGYGGWLVIRGDLAFGTGLVVFAGLLEQFSGQVNNVAAIVNSMQTSLIGARRVFEILDAPVEIKSPADAVTPARVRGHVRFESVYFGYEPGRLVLHGIDLEVRPGQCVAILGATGAGKSALMSLLPRFYDPTAGRVTIDGTDVRRFEVQELRRNIGLVFQESFLFSHTVAANIAFGQPQATREQIERAARIASAHDFISALPHGYDTVLGESGNTLSGGQRQRLALARAILLEPAILLLDDPTAAIDPETEHEIFAALDRAIAGRTTFIVAHRLSTLRRADFIIVLENGRIVQRGTHEELMRQPGPYVRVADLQLVDSRALHDGDAKGGGK
ncbi:MAG: ABC transporter ATP-binding protein [Candidatus Didemnitutus sp.]|nr:ABC transporter ATP-binding protein [Candidatus Didemnitutus sp.]